MGFLLAWVNHGAASIPDGAVTAKDDDATLARALRLKGYTETAANNDAAIAAAIRPKVDGGAGVAQA